MEPGQTYKQYIKEHSYLLSQQDDIFIQRQNYNWGIVHISEVDVSDVQEVYDLISSRFYYKQALPFQPFGGAQEGHYMFKQLNSAHTKDVDLSSLFSDIERRHDVMVYVIEYPNEFHIKNKLLIICDKRKYENMSNAKREVYITMNAYINLVQRKGRVYELPSDDSVIALTDPLHWVWFRKAGYRFNASQMERVQSWIKLNPELKFYLWTDMEDEAELDDFFADCNPEEVAFFKNGTVNVQYRLKTVQFVKDYFDKFEKDKSIRVFDKENFLKIIEERDNSNIMIAKTDFLRAMILHDIGGFYVDFNDCQCLIPLKHWMKELFKTQELIWPCDTMNPKQISNYFLYVPRGSKKFEKYHYNTLAGFSGLWSLMKVPESKVKLANIFLDMTRKYLKKLKQTQTDKPTKLLVETIFPVFSSGKFLSDIEEVMGKQVLKGVDYCDPRGRIFMSMFSLDFLGKKKNDRVIQEFYKYMSAEFSQVGNISLKRNVNVNNEGKMKEGTAPQEGDKFNIQYLKSGYHEEYDDIDRVAPKIDEMLAGLEELYEDPEFHEYIYKKFLSNMSIAVVSLTNIMLQNDTNLTLNDVVPFCFSYMSFCYLTLVVHWGEGTSIGPSGPSGLSK